MSASSSEVEEFCSDAVTSSVDPSTLEVSLGSSCTVWMEPLSILEPDERRLSQQVSLFQQIHRL